MNGVRLVEPALSFQKAYEEMVQEWCEAGETMVPFVLRLEPKPFSTLIEKMNDYKEGINIPETFVPHSTYWLMNKDNVMLGAVNIRHRLNEYLLKKGGHIGYGVRPSARENGYAKMMLRLALEKARDLGLERVLVTCDKDNTASSKTIVSNHGKLESEFVEDNGNVVLRYWITL
ncbi:GNAT family N-acetyltransferase [Metabacillus arenae]|uniref:GNAT family N-acetyltransferase n=1 Tax=Metabacillus arenae TaxID=2771434 RepID=A0A926RYK3_9BACI|nr:GNAT family N-acetyltransferase [Metabacillus arenae]MBD1382171.1 GNAT family N-acetyltransferase [Metabacillus arenae]